jgi:hypothetical protein
MSASATTGKGLIMQVMDARAVKGGLPVDDER